MLGHLIRKEILDHILSLRFLILSVIGPLRDLAARRRDSGVHGPGPEQLPHPESGTVGSPWVRRGICCDLEV